MKTAKSTLVRGSIAEAMVAADLIKKGYTVCFPFSGHSPYDIVVADESHELKRVQVKYRRAKDGIIQVPLRRIHTNSQGAIHKPIRRDWLDAFAIFCPDNECIYYIPIGDMAHCETSFSLRLRPRRLTKRRSKAGNRPAVPRDALRADYYLNPRLLFCSESRTIPELQG